MNLKNTAGVLMKSVIIFIMCFAGYKIGHKKGYNKGLTEIKVLMSHMTHIIIPTDSGAWVLHGDSVSRIQCKPNIDYIPGKGVTIIGTGERGGSVIIETPKDCPPIKLRRIADHEIEITHITRESNGKNSDTSYDDNDIKHFD